MIDIPENISGSELCSSLYPCLNGENGISFRLLHRICRADVAKYNDFDSQISSFQLTKEEKHIIKENNWLQSANLEIRARCLDIMIRSIKDKEEKFKAIRECSNAYLNVFRFTKNLEYLERAITVRIKPVFDNDFLDEITPLIIDNLNLYPRYLNNICSALKKSYTKEQVTCLDEPIAEEYRKRLNEKKITSIPEYLDFMLAQGVIDLKECHHNKALCYEADVDNVLNNQVENTFYPTVKQDIEKAYKEIFQVKDLFPDDYNRIHQKLINTNEYFIGMLSTVGIKTEFEITDIFKEKINHYISLKPLNGPLPAILLCLDFPFLCTEERIQKYISICAKASPVSMMFGKTQLNDKGSNMGSANPEESVRIESHNYSRSESLYALRVFQDYIQQSGIEMDEDGWLKALLACRPSFIKEDNVLLWAKGLSFGFRGDFYAAAFILTPQLERALHDILESKAGRLTLFDKKQQHEPILTTILEKLKPYFDETIRQELVYFLNDGADVNFRNGLLHGLLPAFQIEQYGIYLWWICLKLYFRSNEFYKELNNNIN